MTGELDVAGLAEVARAAGGCGMVAECDDPAHEWFRYSELRERFRDTRKADETALYVQETPPSVVLALIDRLAAAESAVQFKQGLIVDIAADCARAEAAVERVRALADSMEREAPKPQPGGWIADQLRAVLDLTQDAAS